MRSVYWLLPSLVFGLGQVDCDAMQELCAVAGLAKHGIQIGDKWPYIGLWVSGNQAQVRMVFGQ